jgi:transposase
MPERALLPLDQVLYVVGIDIGLETCVVCCLSKDKRQVIKPSSFPNERAGFGWMLERLEQLHCPKPQILIGLEATSRYGENLLHALQRHGYQVALLHPGQMHAFAQQRGVRAKTDRVDALTIARALLSDELRFGYVPSEDVATYRELVRLQEQLSTEIARYKNEIHALLSVLFPEFVQVFADPSGKSALVVLKAYPSAQAIAEAEPDALLKLLREQCPGRYGEPTANRLLALAKASVSSGRARCARETSLRILCDRLEHTTANLERLEAEIEHLVDTDPKVKGMAGIKELGPLTIAVVRAELGDLNRFTRIDQVVAYAGLDLRVRQSGKWKGQTKLSKRGSGRLRRTLYLAAWRCIRAPTSPFGAYYQRLVARGMKKGMAVVAVMRKLLIVAVHLIQTQEEFEATKVGNLLLS